LLAADCCWEDGTAAVVFASADVLLDFLMGSFNLTFDTDLPVEALTSGFVKLGLLLLLLLVRRTLHRGCCGGATDAGAGSLVLRETLDAGDFDDTITTMFASTSVADPQIFSPGAGNVNAELERGSPGGGGGAIGFMFNEGFSMEISTQCTVAQVDERGSCLLSFSEVAT